MSLLILARAELLGAITGGYRHSVGVAGTHGKSTTTGMLSEIMLKADNDSTILGGAIIPSLGSTYRVGNGDNAVFEACEYMDSFLDFYPTIAVILNVELDHVDYFESMEHIYSSFGKFEDIAFAENGCVVYNADDNNVIKAIEKSKGRKIGFSTLDKDAMFYADNICFSGGYPEFDVKLSGEDFCHIRLSVSGEHNVYNALATAAAYFGLECDIYMGTVDIAKQAPNVARMKILGANVVEVKEGLQTLKEAVDAAFAAYARDYKDSIYCIGSVLGPHPFPMMVRDFQSVVGIEAREQFMDMTGELPDAVVACVGGGSNAMGIFSGFLNDPVDIYGVEPLGRGEKLGDHAASLKYGEEGIMHGFNSIMLKDENGEPAPVYSVASGLDYPSSGPEHAFLHDLGRVKYDVVSDDETIDAFFTLSRLEGIIPAIESSHAVAYGMKLAKEMGKGSILINLSGRGDKDMDYIIEKYGIR